MKNRKRESCTSGTVRDEDGNILIYSARPPCAPRPHHGTGIRKPSQTQTSRRSFNYLVGKGEQLGPRNGERRYFHLPACRDRIEGEDALWLSMVSNGWGKKVLASCSSGMSLSYASNDWLYLSNDHGIW